MSKDQLRSALIRYTTYKECEDAEPRDGDDWFGQIVLYLPDDKYATPYFVDFDADAFIATNYIQLTDKYVAYVCVNEHEQEDTSFFKEHVNVLAKRILGKSFNKIKGDMYIAIMNTGCSMENVEKDVIKTLKSQIIIYQKEQEEKQQKEQEQKEQK